MTRHKTTELSIKNARDRFEIIFNSSPNAVLISQLPDGCITDANHALATLTGYSKEDLVGNPDSDLKLWVNPKDRRTFIRRLKSKGTCENLEAQFRRKDGSQFTGIVSAGITNVHGVSQIVSTIRDISERREIEHRNDLLMQRHMALMSSAIDGIHIMDIHGNVVEANATFCQMLGYTHEEATRLNVADWDAQWSLEELMERFRDLIKLNGAIFETKHRRKNGTLLDVEVSTTGAKIDGQPYLFATSHDITERKRLDRALLESEARFRTLAEDAPEAIVIHDLESNRFIDATTSAERLFGCSRDEILQHGPQYFYSSNQPAGAPSFESILDRGERILAGEQMKFERMIRNMEGQDILCEVRLVRLPSEHRKLIRASYLDITERKNAELERSIAATAFESQESLMITNPDGVILRVNKAFSENTGYTSEEIVGQTPRLFKSGRHDSEFYRAMWETLHRTGRWQGEIWDRRKNGEIYPKWLSISAVKGWNGAVTHYVGSHIDITERKASEEKIQHLAFYDHLTGLPNRRLLMDRLQQALAATARSGREGALLFIDLDNFKNLNDTLGHDIGDILLQQVTRRLESCIRNGDTVARLGGDEFVVMLVDLSEQPIEAAAQTEAVGEKIFAALSEAYQLRKHVYRCTASIGVTLFNDNQQAIDELMKQADIAMYQAKKSGRNALRYFDKKMQENITARVSLESELHNAIEFRQLHLYYQIQMDSSHRPLGAEALIRWIHPVRGLVSPDQFIPLAEETGLILPIGIWVLETGCAQLKAWEQDERTCNLTLAVNVSAKQFHQADFAAQVQVVVQRHAINPKLLKLELTESLLLDDIEKMISTMTALKAIGVQFSLDDFGTGYSSLQYLKRLPVDQLKIDKSFVSELARDSSNITIVRTIVAMARSLNMTVIAEGVEQENQRQLLAINGCNHYQGYLFGRPVPIEQFEALLKKS